MSLSDYQQLRRWLAMEGFAVENLSPGAAGLVLLLLGLWIKRSKSKGWTVVGWIFFIFGVLLIISAFIGLSNFIGLLAMLARWGEWLALQVASLLDYVADYGENLRLSNPAL
jgi:hypothetical protein